MIALGNSFEISERDSPLHTITDRIKQRFADTAVVNGSNAAYSHVM